MGYGYPKRLKFLPGNIYIYIFLATNYFVDKKNLTRELKIHQRLNPKNDYPPRRSKYLAYIYLRKLRPRCMKHVCLRSVGLLNHTLNSSTRLEIFILFEVTQTLCSFLFFKFTSFSFNRCCHFI